MSALSDDCALLSPLRLDPVYPPSLSLPRPTLRSTVSRSRYGRLMLMKDVSSSGVKDRFPGGPAGVVRSLLPEFEDANSSTEDESSGDGDDGIAQRKLSLSSDSSSDHRPASKDDQPRSGEARTSSGPSSTPRIEPSTSSVHSASPSSKVHLIVDDDEHSQHPLPPAPPPSPVLQTPSHTPQRSVPRFSLASPVPAVAIPRHPAPRLTSPTTPSRVASAPAPSAVSAGDKSLSVTIIVRGCYLLTHVDGHATAPGKSFLSLNLTRGAGEGRGLQVVEDERVIRQIDIDRIERCACTDPQTVAVTYDRSAGSKTAEVEFRLASHLDVQQVVALLNGLTSSAPASSASNTPSKPMRTQECVYKAWIEQWIATPEGSGYWVKRFARLFTHRLLFYRSSTSPLPVHVFPLTARDERGVLISINDERHLIIEFPSDKTGVSDVTWRALDSAAFAAWTAALRISVPAEPLSPGSTPAMTVSPVAGPPPTIALAPTLSSQRTFMSYVFELSIVKPLFPSTLATCAAFQSATPGSFLRRRNPALHAVDSCLASYHLLMTSLSALWSETRLVMVDEFEQSGSGQIGFSFPGFDSQVFDVGRLSVVACAQLLSAEAHALRFNHNDYNLAIESSSPAKEMMQSSPDFSSLYSSGQKDKAKALAAQSQRLLLHHCSLASYIKAHSADLANADTIPWPDVITSVDAGKNVRTQELFMPVSYLYNPSAASLHELIVQLKKERDLAGAAAFASFPELSGVAVTPSTPVTPPPTPSQVTSPASGEKGKRGSIFGGKGKGKLSPASPTLTSPTSPASPSTPASPARAAGELRCLCDAVHMLLLLRTLLQYRRHALSTLLNTVNKTLPALSSSSDRVAHTVVTSVKVGAEAERNRVVFVLSVLPKAEEIDKEVRRQRRERREKRAELEVRRQATREKEHESTMRTIIDGAKRAIDDFEDEEEEEEEDEEEEDEDNSEVEVAEMQSSESGGDGDSTRTGSSEGSEDGQEEAPRMQSDPITAGMCNGTVYYV